MEDSWEDLYEGVARANNLLNNMERAQDVVSEEVFERMQAEARFLRAFFYLHLTELYGDIPLLTEVPTIEEAQVSNTPKGEIVDQIYDDLSFAEERLPTSWSGDDEGRATKGAAHALEARVALYNEDYGRAISAAEEVITLGEYELYPSYENLFQYEGIRNSEIILDLPYSQGVETHDMPIRLGTRNVGAWATHVPSQSLVDTYQATDGEPIDQSQVYEPDNPFENRDPRLDATIIRPQSTFAGYVYETHPDSTETTRINGGDRERVENQNVTNPFASFTGYNFRKYLAEEDFPARSTSSELHFILIRYAEVLLTYAEAKIESGDIDQTVLDRLNRVRARAYGVSPSQTDEYPAITTMDQDELRNEVRYERKVELALEGFRLYDIRRWDIADEVMNGTLFGRPRGAYQDLQQAPSIDIDANHHADYSGLEDLYRSVETRTFQDRHWLWPIPQAEINVNDNINQNPNW